MTKPKRSHSPEAESLAELRGDCARMAAHWVVADPAFTEAVAAETPVRELHGITVPARSARLLEGTEYGD